MRTPEKYSGLPCPGNAVCGPQEWEILLGTGHGPDNVELSFPWPLKLLDRPCPFVPGKRIIETHCAFFGLPRFNGQPLNILYLRRICPPGTFYFDPPWYSDQTFATGEMCSARWYLMFREAIPGSEGLTFREQKELLPEEYDMPYAIEEVVKDILFLRARKTVFNGRMRVRTRTKVLDQHVYVGDYDFGGLWIALTPDEFQYERIGIGAARVPGK